MKGAQTFGDNYHQSSSRINPIVGDSAHSYSIPYNKTIRFLPPRFVLLRDDISGIGIADTDCDLAYVVAVIGQPEDRV